MGLWWKDIDWTKRQILIHRGSFHAAGGGFVYQPPKTKLGKRTVQLGQGEIDRLRTQMVFIDLLSKMAREKWQDYELAFPSEVDTPIGGERITHEFPVLAKMAGLPEIWLHDCRHMAASILISHGIPPIIVAGVTCPNFGRMQGTALAILRPAMLTLS